MTLLCQRVCHNDEGSGGRVNKRVVGIEIEDFGDERPITKAMPLMAQQAIVLTWRKQNVLIYQCR